eukprot:jgi/Botrbrau1/16519/Bobra.0336s0002.1
MWHLLLWLGTLLILLWSWSCLGRWRLRHIPGYMGVWLLGNIPDIVKHHGTNAFYEEGHKKYGNVFKIWFGRQPVVVVGDPVSGRAIGLRSKRRTPLTFPVTFFTGKRAAIPKADLLTLEDETYHSSLKSVWPGAFRSAKMEEYVNIMKGSVAEAIAQLQLDALQRKEINLLDFYGKVALSIVGSTAFGVDLDVFQTKTVENASGDALAPKLVAAIEDIFDGFGIGTTLYVLLGYILPEPWALPILQAFAAVLPDRGLVKAAKARKVTFGLLYPLLWDAQERAGLVTPSKQGSLANLGVSKVAGGGFMSHVVNAEHRDTKDPFTEAEKMAQAFSFLTGGFETSAVLMTNTTYLLLKHPEKLAKLRKELDSIPEEQMINLSSKPTPYLSAVIKEGLRFYAVGLLSRVAPSDLNVCGYHIPKGTWIHINNYRINRNSDAWERPDDFLPERWIPGDPMETRTPENLASFGLGALQCAGMRFAQHEVNLVLAHIFRKMDFALSPGQDDVPMSSLFVTKPRFGVLAVPKSPWSLRHVAGAWMFGLEPRLSVFC